MIGKIAISAALLGFNDLGCSVTPTFLCRKQILFTNISTLSKNEQKINLGSKKKFQDICPRDIEFCHIAAVRRVKLWSLNTNLFFKEAHQLTKFT